MMKGTKAIHILFYSEFGVDIENDTLSISMMNLY